MKITLCNLVTEERQELDPNTHIEFGEGVERITIFVIGSAIYISGDNALRVSPRAPNLIGVQTERKRP